jgi:hypothetical protein
MIILNTEQLSCSHRIKDFIYGDDFGFFLIDGAGGTGKTTVVTSLMDNPDDFLFLGATNKVCANIKQSLQNNGIDTLGVKVKTIARFLSWRKTKDHENKDVITMRLPDIDTIPKIIVIDEVSMLTQEQVEWILKLRCIRKIILIGDKMQIPPIEEIKYRKNGFHVSRIFEHIDYSFTLTIQNRQNEGSNLFNAINAFRNNMHHLITFKSFAEKYNNGLDVLIMDLYSKEFREFTKENRCTSVCYKNATVNSHLWVLNGYKNPKILKAGDDVYFEEYYKNGENVFYTSESCKILEIEDAKKKVNFPNGDIVEMPILKANIIFDTGEPYTIEISKSYNESIKRIYGKVYYLAQKETNKKKKAELYTFYQDYKTSLASLSKPYAITAHKAQGSTYDNVIIPLYDFRNSLNHEDCNQLFYVAISRAKNKIIFVTSPSNFVENSKRVNFTQEERHQIATKTNFKCSTITGFDIKNNPIHCEAFFEDVRNFEIHHIIPLSKGGTNKFDNLQILCKQCHKDKHNERSI